jgi:hypothetical protein
MGTVRASREVRHYFEYSDHGIEVVEDGLREIPFGEYLVERRALSRAQLFSALQEQDRNPGVRFGEVVAALGFLPYPEIDRLLTEFHAVSVIEIEA